MAATGSEAIMIELMKDGWEWIKSERYHKKEAEKAKKRELNNPMKTCVLKYDHFENIHRLHKDLEVVEGAPNFRKVTGYLVYGTGQPTKVGFKNALDKIFAANDSAIKKVLWTSMRQEPVVYMNGESFTPRFPDKMNENMEFPGVSGEEIEWLQESFVQTISERLEESKENRNIPKEHKGKVKYYRDTYAEHPDDRINIEYIVPLENDDALVTLNGLYAQVKGNHEFGEFRAPIVDEKAPKEADFDDILNVMREQGPDTACVFNCQMGKGRTTTGMILACIIKDVLYGDPSKTYYVDDIVKPDDYSDEDEVAEERAKRGQFSVVFKIFEYLPEAKEAKAHLDYVIDLCGEPPKGTGLQNLRECILWTQTKHDFEPRLKKPFWKQMSVNFIERYCYLICFATYVKLFAPRGFDFTFTMWMDARAELREIISRGMKSFNWD